jgi:hypothetical protein
MSRRIIICALINFIFIFMLILDQKNLSAGSDILIIRAQHTIKAPQGIDDPIWQQIKPVQVPVEGRGELARVQGAVATRVLYTDDNIYFLLKWEDPTRSTVKQAWQFDGEKWFHMAGNEDRIALLFEITRIDKFATRGCAITCHSPADLPREQWKFATRNAVEKGDLWHWKAARSAPYKHADDAWLTVAGNPTGSYRKTGRRKDVGNGGDQQNQTPDGIRPLYMQDPSKKPRIPGFLLMEETKKITDYSIFKPGDIIPFRLPVRPGGSRFDVKAESRYGNRHWQVMLSRKLNTGHEDDVVFNPMKRYSFAMAVFDDSGADHSKATKALLLVFNR